METLNLGDSGLLPNQKTSICESPDLITTCSARRWLNAPTPAYREIAVRRGSRLGLFDGAATRPVVTATGTVRRIGASTAGDLLPSRNKCSRLAAGG